MKLLTFWLAFRMISLILVILHLKYIPKTDKKVKLYVLALISIIFIKFMNMQIRKFAIQTNE